LERIVSKVNILLSILSLLDRERISEQRSARLRLPRRQPVDWHAAGARHFNNANQALLPGYFVRVRVPLGAEQALLVPEVAVGADQAGRYVLTVNADGIVEQRRVQPGQTTGEMRVIESGLKPDERVVVASILDAVPGQKVNSQLQVPKSTTAEPAGSQ
jgi:hypothetical protein